MSYMYSTEWPGQYISPKTPALSKFFQDIARIVILEHDLTGTDESYN